MTTLADEMLADLDNETGITGCPITLGHVQAADLTADTPLQDIHPDAWNDILNILGVLDRNGEAAGLTLNQLTRQAMIRDGLYESDKVTTLLLTYLAATNRVHRVELSRHDPRRADLWFLGADPNAATGPAAPLDGTDPALDEDPSADTDPWALDIPALAGTGPAPF
jgi:hypothetical protein